MFHCTLDGRAVNALPPELALYPYGTFTTFVVAEGAVLALDDHVRRLREGAAELWGATVTGDRVLSTLRSHLGLHARDEAQSVRVTVYPASFDYGAPERAAGAQIVITSRPSVHTAIASDLKVQTTEFVRSVPRLKTVAFLEQVQHRRSARIAGFDDALYVSEGHVLEGTSWGVIAFIDGTAVTPAGELLESISVRCISAVATMLGYTAHTRRLAVSELDRAELVVAANANRPIRPVRSVDGVPMAVNTDLAGHLAGAYERLPRTPLSR